MGRGINKVILVGNLGGDPELRQTNSGTSVCNFNLATSFVRRNPETGDTTETTEWHRVVLFKRLAEIADQYLKKGDQAYIEGRLSTRKWQDREGNDRWTTEVIGSELQMLGSPRGGQRGLQRRRSLDAVVVVAGHRQQGFRTQRPRDPGLGQDDPFDLGKQPSRDFVHRFFSGRTVDQHGAAALPMLR